MKLCLIIFILLFVQSGFSQVVWKADIPDVEKNDYYTIELDQELIGAGLQYLKIFDGDGNEVPYFVRSSDPIQEINNFESYSFKNVIKDSLNIIIVDNQATEPLNRFCIVLQKAETQKFTAIRGSNDLKQWYIVKQTTGILSSGQQSRGNTEMLILDFPQGNYRYYEITLWGHHSSPLDVLQVGKIKNSNLYGNFVEINVGRFIQENDSENHQTYLRFPNVQHDYCINKIEFGIKNKPDYYRQAIVSDSFSYNKEYLSLSSEKENLFFTNDYPFSPGTYITIENQHNPPLAVDSVKIYGLCRYACMYLETGRKYILISDQRNPVTSKYDIEHFRDKIPANLSVLRTKNLHNSPMPEEVIPERKLSLIEQPVFLWSVIIIVGAFLVFICVKMISELKKKKS